ncbi:MAG TPA: glycogen/starch/alpha-glucan phosphorylase [Planctomycetota bacterium]|nr:glycogen/starch/alpha-glucan phosphorylase [Planctomycetota bacterium]
MADRPRKPPALSDLRRYECGPFKFRDVDLYDRHLMFDNAVDAVRAQPRQRFEALARSLRDVLMQRWILTKQTQDKVNPKEVYYISLEFLIGRTLAHTISNMGVGSFVRADLQSDGQDWRDLAEEEPDAGLGNGGLGRLAACFLDSMATLQIPAMGYGLRYEYGIFRQRIVDGAQVEEPDPWLRRPDPWEVARPEQRVGVTFHSAFAFRKGEIVPEPGHAMNLLGVPYDRPVVGWGGRCVNTLRLWEAATPDVFRFGEFADGDFFGAVSDRVLAESLTRVLYPDDSTPRGRSLRFMQEFFLVSCSLQDILIRFRRRGNDWRTLPDKVAVQLNDTHPAIAVAELMRLLMDQAGLAWERAWDLTVRTLAYTNHTLMPEALEKWPVELFEQLLPRHLEIVYEINARFLDEARRRLGDDAERARRMSLVEEGPVRKIRMAHLAIVGTHSTNGVAEIHGELVKTRLVPDFAAMFPDRFLSVTNGVTPRRWLLQANPGLADLVTSAVGDAWITDLERLRALLPLAGDAAFRQSFRDVKRAAKSAFAGWLKRAHGTVVDPSSIFDCQVKRIHEYKRQLLNALHVAMLAVRRPGDDAPPRTFFFAGKAAPAYRRAKLVIRLIHALAAAIDADKALRGRLKVVFLPDYNVTLAERLIPAADVSEQISTAGFEASGTSNMKFMMNGALTIGTRDGATIEMAREAGEENLFLFGLTAAQVAETRGWYDPRWHYANEPETREAVDFLFGLDRGTFDPLRAALLEQGDYFMHLADLRAYTEAHARLAAAYADREGWARKAVLNVGSSGRFSSDRTIRDYAERIWKAVPCPIP